MEKMEKLVSNFLTLCMVGLMALGMLRFTELAYDWLFKDIYRGQVVTVGFSNELPGGLENLEYGDWLVSFGDNDRGHEVIIVYHRFWDLDIAKVGDEFSFRIRDGEIVVYEVRTGWQIMLDRLRGYEGYWEPLEEFLGRRIKEIDRAV